MRMICSLIKHFFVHDKNTTSEGKKRARWESDLPAHLPLSTLQPAMMRIMGSQRKVRDLFFRKNIGVNIVCLMCVQT